jgi:hypothetical protein
MDLTLTDDDARVLQQVLNDCREELMREIARTDAREFRHQLVLRQEAVERILGQLHGRAPGAPPSGRGFEVH